MSVKVTAPGLNELRADLQAAGKDAPKQAKKVLSKTALEVKKKAKAKSSGIAHAPHYPNSISYDLTWSGTSGSAEIGPDKGKPQGALGNVLEYGTSKNAPLSHLGPALDEEGPNFEKYMGDIGEDLLS